MNQQPGDPLLLFYSYAHEDEALRNELDKHLLLLQYNSLIMTRDDHHIPPGADRSYTVGQYLKEARVTLLLISPDYLASASCYQTEMPQALERHQTGDALVIPVLLRPVDMDVTPFAHLQSLPRSGKPVTLWEHQDAAFHEIAKELRLLLEDRRATSSRFLQSLQMIEHHQSFQTGSGVQAKIHEEMGYRITYLKYLIRRYNTVMLPIGPVEGLSLQAIFQPLTLRHDPLAAGDLQHEKRHALFGDNAIVRQEKEPVIVAQTCEEALEKTPQKRMVILGGPGAGKTTTLQFFIHEYAQEALVDPSAHGMRNELQASKH